MPHIIHRFVFQLCVVCGIVFSSCKPSVTPDPTQLQSEEDQTALAIIDTLPEVVALRQIHPETEHLITAKPGTAFDHYWIETGYTIDSVWLTRFHFFVYADHSIYLWNSKTNTKLPLEEWRKGDSSFLPKMEMEGNDREW